eukprot:TRINITY_DN225_c0_g1_i8.p2 TRINITY_DN225_c0_g1~~TRINITY_DN225_c0_g1_i8.p2  ORF type:complete len:150 (+),score=43.11 TRINITY_DN225_c0_g1_i8:122-571(+)
MIRRPPRSTLSSSSAASDVYKRQVSTQSTGRSSSAVLKMVQRLTYRRRHCYATKSNGVRKVKTPGGKLTLHNVAKKCQAPKCGDCHKALQGIPVMKPYLYKRLAKNKKNVSRAYGGNRCAGCVRQRIVRAFLIEEQKIVKQVLKKQKKK